MDYTVDFDKIHLLIKKKESDDSFSYRIETRKIDIDFLF